MSFRDDWLEMLWSMAGWWSLAFIIGVAVLVVIIKLEIKPHD